MITITEALGNGDVLLVDYKAKEVKLNGVDVPFTGIMNPLVAGFNEVNFEFTGTVDCDITITYNRTFL